MNSMTHIKAAQFTSLKRWHVQTTHAVNLHSSLYKKTGNRLQRVCSSNSHHQQLLSTLQTLSEDDLVSWVSDNRNELSLSFLSWIAEQEAAASGEEQQRLWDLGSRLMALREGLTPIATAQLSQELAAAASAAARQEENNPAALATSSSSSAALSESVRQNAALGLSVEGMELLEQQAAALEATMGARRAQALTEILGRKKVNIPQEADNLAAADAAGRILEVLVQIEDRFERASMLPEAFTPPVDNNSDRNSEEEEFLYTTPLQLLQSVDLWLRRAQDSLDNDNATDFLGLRMLNGATLGVDGDQLVVLLEELREDILAAWESSSSEDF